MLSSAFGSPFQGRSGSEEPEQGAGLAPSMGLEGEAWPGLCPGGVGAWWADCSLAVCEHHPNNSDKALMDQKASAPFTD